MDDNKQHSHRILLVEDSKALARLLIGSLSAKGFSIDHAPDGRQALAALEHTVPEVIVTDYEMPIMDGPTLCQKIRERPEWRTIPIIMLTSRDDTESIMAGINAGADDYLSKKIAVEVLEIKSTRCCACSGCANR